MKYTLRQLQVFIATARTESVSDAARELHMSQSAASESLKSLESTYGIQLFDRVGKKLKLNAFGMHIRDLAENLIAHGSALEQSLQKRDDEGSLCIGATLSIGNYLAINILSDFKRQYPKVHTRLEVENTSHIVQKVLSYELDIGLIEGEIAHPDLAVTPWRKDELVVFCAPNSHWATNKALNDQDLCDIRWILRESGSGTRQTFDYAMHGLVSNLQVEMELQHTEAIKRAVERDAGVGCLSRITLEDAFRRGSLIPLAVPHRDFSRMFYFIERQHRFQTQFVRLWRELCQAS